MTWQVYIIRNEGGRRYIGLSEDVERRLGQHNAGVSKWTAGRGPWRIEWRSAGLGLGEARKLENRMKRQKGGRGLERLMEQHGERGS